MGLSNRMANETLSASGNTIAEVIDDLERQFPGLRARLLDDGRLRRFVNVYLGDQDVRFLDGLSSTVGQDAEIWIVPAIAGG